MLFEQTLSSLLTSCCGVEVGDDAGFPSALTKRYTVPPGTLETIWYTNEQNVYEM